MVFTQYDYFYRFELFWLEKSRTEVKKEKNQSPDENRAEKSCD